MTQTEQLNLIRTNILLSRDFKKWRQTITKNLKKIHNDRLIHDTK